MSETKEIPAEMIRAATAAMLTRAGYNKHDYPEVHQSTHARWITARKDATAILEAAGVAALIHENHEARRLLVTRVEAKDLDAAMDRIAQLEAELATFREVEMRETESLQKKIAELEADTDRLRWLMADIDGASNVVSDRHSFASDFADERGHDEPTDEDELDGFRRLIDMAMGGASE